MMLSRILKVSLLFTVFFGSASVVGATRSGCFKDENSSAAGFINRQAEAAKDCRAKGFEGLDPYASDFEQDCGDWYFSYKCGNTSNGLWGPCYRNEDGRVIGTVRPGIQDRQSAGRKWCLDNGYGLPDNGVESKDCTNFYFQHKCDSEPWSECISDATAREFGFKNRDAHGAGECRDKYNREGADPNQWKSCWDLSVVQVRCKNTSRKPLGPCYRDEDADAMGYGSKREAAEAWCHDNKNGDYTDVVGSPNDCGNFYSQFKCDYLWTGCLSNEDAEKKKLPNRDALGASLCRGHGHEGVDPRGHKSCGDSKYNFKCRETSKTTGPWSPCYRYEDAQALGYTDRDAAGRGWCKQNGYHDNTVQSAHCGNFYYQFKCIKGEWASPILEKCVGWEKGRYKAELVGIKVDEKVNWLDWCESVPLTFNHPNGDMSMARSTRFNCYHLQEPTKQYGEFDITGDESCRGSSSDWERTAVFSKCISRHRGEFKSTISGNFLVGFGTISDCADLPEYTPSEATIPNGSAVAQKPLRCESHWLSYDVDGYFGSTTTRCGDLPNLLDSLDDLLDRATTIVSVAGLGVLSATVYTAGEAYFAGLEVGTEAWRAALNLAEDICALRRNLEEDEPGALRRRLQTPPKCSTTNNVLGKRINIKEEHIWSGHWDTVNPRLYPQNHPLAGLVRDSFRSFPRFQTWADVKAFIVEHATTIFDGIRQPGVNVVKTGLNNVDQYLIELPAAAGETTGEIYAIDVSANLEKRLVLSAYPLR